MVPPRPDAMPVKKTTVNPEPDNLNNYESPLVSVIVPTYNRPALLSESLYSLCKQIFCDFEVIVINDAGENVQHVCDQFARHVTIRYECHTANRGLAATRNTGIRCARGKYLAYLDDDDVYYPEHLKTLTATLEQSGKWVAYTQANLVVQQRVGEKLIKLEGERICTAPLDLDHLLVSNSIPSNAIMYRRECIKQVGEFDESLHVLEDWDLLIRLAQHWEFHYIPIPTCEVRWRTDASNMTTGARARFVEVQKRIYQRYYSLVENRPAIRALQKQALVGLARQAREGKLQKIMEGFGVIAPVSTGTSTPTSQTIGSASSVGIQGDRARFNIRCRNAPITRRFVCRPSDQGTGHGFRSISKRLPGYSFCITAGGQRPKKLERLLESIRNQRIPQFEMIVAGLFESRSDITYVPMEAAARAGQLTVLRNAAAARSRHAHLVFVDDDIIFQPGWFLALQPHADDHDLFACRLLNLDGTRHWDWNTFGGPRGHVLLDYHTTDDHLYITGGMGIMKAQVWETIGWDENRGLGEGEDIDFYHRALDMGFRACRCGASVAVHDDERYTQVGRIVLKRSIEGVRAWLNRELEALTPQELMSKALKEFNEQKIADAADSLRYCLMVDAAYEPAKRKWDDIIKSCHGFTDSGHWTTRSILESGLSMAGQTASSHETVVPSSVAGGGRKGSPLASIIMPVFNQIRFTKQCMESIRQNTPPGLYEIIVVDNASTDETSQYLKSCGNHVRSIQNGKNMGFGFACNQGAKVSWGEYLVFLNNDTKPLVGWLENSIEHFKRDPKAGIVGGKLLYPDGTIQHGGIELVEHPGHPLNHTFLSRFHGLASDHPPANRCEEVQAITGACLFIPRPLFWEVGGFSEEFGMYFEDFDLSLRVQALGKKVIYEPRSVLVHYEGKSGSNNTKGNEELLLRAAKVFYLKWKITTENHLSERSHPKQGHDKPFLPVELKWDGAFLCRNGSASAMRSHVLSLDRSGAALQVEPWKNDPEFVKQMDFPSFIEWKRLFEAKIQQDVFIAGHQPFDECDRYRLLQKENPHFHYYIGYTAFETDRIPSSWVEACNRMDEIWVPSRFNRETFVRSGVADEKLHVVPTGIDVGTYQTTLIQPLEIPGRKSFAFLAVFEWSHRKGWDILLKAYLDAFSPSDDVVLILHSWSQGGRPVGERVERFIMSLGRKQGDCASIMISDEPFSAKQMLSLYGAANAFVLPSRGEGWGMAYMEAMAMGLPVIGTRWGGPLDFMNDQNSYLIDCEIVNIPEALLGEAPLDKKSYKGHRWAEPSAEHTARLMREVYDNREQAKSKGLMAREHIFQNRNTERILQVVIKHLERINRSTTFNLRRKKNTQRTSGAISHSPVNVSVKWDAVFLASSGYSSAMRSHALSLNRAGVRLQVGLMESKPKFIEQMGSSALSVWKHLSETSISRDICISGYRPFDNGDMYRLLREKNPGFGYYIGYTMFETDRLPGMWVNPCNEMDEIWVPSRFNLETFGGSGVLREKIHVIPIGIEAGEYQLEIIKPLVIPGKKGFVFLSVFEWTNRKGWDVLIKAYLNAFSRSEAVTLVIHAWSETGKSIRELAHEFISSLGKDPTRVPTIVVLEGYLSHSEMPSLYRAADAFVLSTRGEGWGLPFMEAMAMGLPTIGTRCSAHLDFMNDQNSHLIDCNVVDIPDHLLGEPPLHKSLFWGHRWAEPSVEHTARLMREVYDHPEQAREKGLIAREEILRDFNNQSIAQVVIENLKRIENSELFKSRRTGS